MSDPSLQGTLARLDARIDWERRDRSAGWRVDLDPIHDLLVRTGRPDRGFRICHVAGSKGKGSVASLIAAGLRRAGRRVGVYASPHVERIHERIALDGTPIDDAGLVRALTAALDAVEEAERDGGAAAGASWFDIVTAAALCAFRDAGVDWAVLEVGLGGRLDSTNAIDPPALAVVMTIALEHTAILGSTLAEIAAEKGGIVKSGSRLVTGCDPDGDAGRVLAGIAREHGVPHVVAWSADDVGFERANLRVARAALDALNEVDPDVDAALLTDDAVVAARLPGRMERLESGGVPVVLDGAHVPASVVMAMGELSRERPGPCAVVFALHREKSATEMLKALRRGTVERLFLTTVPGSGVHLEAGELAEAAARLGLPHEAFDAPGDALEAALGRARSRPGEGAWVFATGSLYLIGALRPGLTSPDRD
ncbi:MAG: bifunctional folylpolyglutamate synthase/dihydrofolate synthase [Planctomycetota bacterium]